MAGCCITTPLVILNDGQSVAIKRREVDGQAIASYQGLMTCGSVWSCPRCSAVIAHTRAEEIGRAVRECHQQGGKVYLMTLTMRHTSRDRLAELWDGLSVGWRSAFGTRKWTGQRSRIVERAGKTVAVKERLGDAELFDVAGMTRVVEATYGAPTSGGNGWHLRYALTCLSFSQMLTENGLRAMFLRPEFTTGGRKVCTKRGSAIRVLLQWMSVTFQWTALTTLAGISRKRRTTALREWASR